MDEGLVVWQIRKLGGTDDKLNVIKMYLAFSLLSFNNNIIYKCNYDISIGRTEWKR